MNTLVKILSKVQNLFLGLLLLGALTFANISFVSAQPGCEARTPACGEWIEVDDCSQVFFCPYPNGSVNCLYIGPGDCPDQ